MAHISEYSIVTFQRKPGHWRAAIFRKVPDRSSVPGETVRTFVTPRDSASESEAKLEAERLIQRLPSR
jgi:hypothetical protein